MAQAMEEDTPKALSVNVLHITNEARMTYGLRHQDYQRYRKHCTHRISRLRQLLHLSQSMKKKDTKRKDLPAVVEDSRYLELILYEAERAWAYAMELKQESESSLGTRKHHHAINKLKRAYQHADTLYQLSTQVSVHRLDALTMKAYAMTIKGYYLTEKERWKDALDLFLAARGVYEALTQTGQGVHQEALYCAAMDGLEPHLRLCAYRLKIDTSQGIHTVLATGTTLPPALETELESVQHTHRVVPVEMTWRATSFAIKDTMVADAIARAQEKAQQHKNLPTSSDALDAMLLHWTLAEKAARKSLQHHQEVAAKVTCSKSNTIGQEVSWVHGFSVYHLHAHSIQHRLAQISTLQGCGEEKQVIQFYDGILKSLGTLRQHCRIEDDAFYMELDTLTHYYKASRCLSVADMYAKEARAPEAIALYQRARVYTVQAKQSLQQVRHFQDTLLTVQDTDLAAIDQHLRTHIAKTQALWSLAHPEAQTDITHQMESLTLEGKTSALLDRLEEYPSLPARTAGAPCLVEFPPRLQPVACKPIYFDLAANQIQYPDALADKVGRAKKGWSFFGFGQ
ncbi:hypothetical protein BDF14DRAFT_1789389 [Spinellus fusiger]|nr:hypothetical protein BDF14DRAFT_1789389 [Spinellus fusiger]